MAERDFTLNLVLREGYEFDVDFQLPGVDDLHLDEPEPLGQSNGPNAARVLGAAVGNCLASSLLFCLRKSRVTVSELRVVVNGSIVRNEEGRLRIGGLAVRLEPGIAEEDRARMGRCLDIFEDFCIVTGSVRDGVDVEVEVLPVEPAEQDLAAATEPA